MTESDNSQVIDSFREQNKADGVRVFVAGGHRDGNDPAYVEAAYNLGRQIIKMDFKLDFGLSNAGIMGAVARGVLDGWNTKQSNMQGLPIQAITTKEYYALYPRDDELLRQIENVILAKTLEERKQKLLDSDIIVFAPGGVGTLDELAYDCVAMQDGLLQVKPFIFYNVNGFFHHLLEFLKFIALEGFAEPMPFIVVDDDRELSIVFRLFKYRTSEAYENARKLAYELPYFLKRKTDSSVHVEDLVAEVDTINAQGSEEDKSRLAEEFEQAYLEKEIERMYERLAKTGRDTSIVSDKLTACQDRPRHLNC